MLEARISCAIRYDPDHPSVNSLTRANETAPKTRSAGSNVVDPVPANAQVASPHLVARFQGLDCTRLTVAGGQNLRQKTQPQPPATTACARNVMSHRPA